MALHKNFPQSPRAILDPDIRAGFRTKKDRSLELKSVFHECAPGRRKIAVKVVDIFGNDTMTIVDVSVGKYGGSK